MQTTEYDAQHTFAELPALRVDDIVSFHPGNQVTIDHLNGLCWLCTDKGTVHSIQAMPYHGYEGKVKYIHSIIIRKYRCRRRGWQFRAGDQVRITIGW